MSPGNIQTQKCILEQIRQMGLCGIDIYTRYAVEAVMAFINHRKGIPERGDEQESYSLEKRMKELSAKQKMYEQLLMTVFAERSVFVYQSKKVGSTSIAGSIRNFGIYGFHVHDFAWLDIDRCFVKDIIKKGSGKVISIVREPIARTISLLWHNWSVSKGYKKYNSLKEMENHFYTVPNEEDEFIWYLKEFQTILDINIYEYPFDRTEGYSIIEKNGISLLLLKMEKLNELDQIIGNFLKIENFKLEKYNMAGNKSYKYAYQNYLENVKFPADFFEYYYSDNKYMDYFYTEEEKNIFRERWKSHISDTDLVD